MIRHVKSHQRHFPYKHPTFGTSKNPKAPIHWEGSIYYWWWSYLKRNNDYLKCCEYGGVGGLCNLYQDFGDVRGTSFKDWWMEGGRGAKLFANPQAEDSIRLLSKGESALDESEALTISIPMYYPKKIILNRLKELVDEKHSGRRGHQLAKKSKAKYRVRGQPNVPAIKQALAVYDFYSANPNLKLWEIGNLMPKFQMEHKIDPDDTKEVVTNKKAILSATVARYLRRAKQSILNTSLGTFP